MNSPASLRARLLNASKQSGENFQAVLTRYAMERFFYRLEESNQRDQFHPQRDDALRGVGGESDRPTKDLDLLGFGAPTPDDVAR